jgi:amidase
VNGKKGTRAVKLSEYAALDGLALGELVRRREVSPGELVALSLEAVEVVNPALGAVIETHEDRAEVNGDAGRGRGGQGPFAGVPFMLKDIGCAEAGRLCEAGSRLLRGWRASDDTELMRRFRSAGLVNVGRTTTSEFACTATVETAATGTTRNPWKLSHSTAGSSGGSAAAVASGIVPIAHGSDGGGSIRMPASCCGVVGLKPSRGRVSPAPASTLPGDLSVEFVLTRSVRDVAAVLDAVAGPAPGDPYVISPPEGSYIDRLHRREKLRIAFTTEHFWNGLTDPEVAAAAQHVANVCEQLGHSVQQTRPLFDWEPFVDATLDVWSAMTAAAVSWAAAQTGRRPGPEALEGHTRSWDDRGRGLSALELVAATETLAAVSQQVARFFADFDVLVTPTIPTLPLALGQYDPAQEVPSSWYYESAIGNLESTTSVFNCTGQPAISLPLGQSAEGLPIGVHLAGRFGGEVTLLALAASLEEAVPWASRRPAIHVGALSDTIGDIR